MRKSMFEFKSEGSERMMVKLFALTPSSKHLEWYNPYTKDTDFFFQKINKHGTKMYEVPLPYAQRLIAGQQYMYLLAYPDIITVRFQLPGGGTEFRKVYRVTEKLDKDGKVVIDPDKKKNPHGYPTFISAFDEQEDVTEIDNGDPLAG
jgi:hypothetical protein